MLVKIHNVRLAFPQLFEAKTVNGEGEPAYSASFIIEKTQLAAIKEINDAVKVVAAEKWTTKADAVLKAAKNADKLPLHDGDAKADYTGYAGNLYISARNKVRPLVIDRDKSPLTPADGRPYAGCYVNAHVDIWAQDNQFGKRVNASLVGVQFLKDGDAFAGGASAKPDDFDDLSEGADASDLA